MKFLLKNEKIVEKLQTYDTIIPTPINRKRKNERGYNQSYLIAKEISKITGVSLETECLYKTKNIKRQSELGKEARQINVIGAYKLKNLQKINNKKVLLVDDIFTTGSTASECCKIIKEAEPSKIGVFTIAKD